MINTVVKLSAIVVLLAAFGSCGNSKKATAAKKPKTEAAKEAMNQAPGATPQQNSAPAKTMNEAERTAPEGTGQKKPTPSEAAPAQPTQQPPPDAPPGKVLGYACPMHPDYVSPTPGKCAKCGMDYVKLKK